MRIQLALNVKDIERSVNFYSRLFGVKPHKQHPGYANFVIEDPALKLVLFENVDADERINHLGIETFSQQELDTASARLTSAGLADKFEENEVCCDAAQNKVWSMEPDGIAWEWYRITDDAPRAERAACCR